VRRGGPLKRKTPLRRRKPPEVVRLSVAGSQMMESATKELRERRDWLGHQRCVFCRFSADPGDGRIQRAHMDEGKGMGWKTSDWHEIPLCERHHRLLGNDLHPPSTVIPRTKLLVRAVMAMADHIVSGEYAAVAVHEMQRRRLGGT
jgi:hypothetical protein